MKRTAAKNSRVNPFIHYILPIGILAILTFIAYYPSLKYPFQFDDLANITRYFDIRHNNLRKLIFSGTRWIIYWINSIYYQFGKFDPFIYRIGNLFIHMGNGVLIFFIIRFVLTKLSTRPFFRHHALTIAALTSLLFLLHPVQTQTVSYVIQGQLEGAATFFTLLMIGLYLYRTTIRTPLQRYIATCALFVAALLSCGTKEITIIIPFLIVLTDWFFIAHGSWRSLKKRWYLPTAFFALITSIYVYFLKPTFFASIFCFSYCVKNNIGNVITHDPHQLISPVIFCISQFKVILHYLTMYLWPFNISIEYDWLVVHHFFSLDCIIPLIIILTIIGLLARLFYHDRTHPIIFGALWFAICLAPRCSIMPSPELMVDYKAYLASIGWLFILAVMIVYVIDYAMRAETISRFKFLDKTKNFMPYLCVIPLIFFTVKRNKVWQNGLNFWGDVIAHAPGKARAYNNYGVELSQNWGKYAEAIPYFQKAISMDNNYADPHNNLAVSYAQIGNMDGAIEAIINGIKIYPFYPEGYNNLASFLMHKNDFEKAKIALTNALRLRPYYGKAHFNLGRIYLHEQKIEQAWECFKRACIEGDFDTELGFTFYGKISLMLEKHEDALIAYQKLLQLNATNLEAQVGCAAALLSLKQYDQAFSRYTELTKNAPNCPAAWQGLGEYYFVTGNSPQALSCFLRVKTMIAPTVYLMTRLAACYERIGNPAEARNTLTELLALSVPAETVKQIEEARTNLIQRYNLT